MTKSYQEARAESARDKQAALDQFHQQVYVVHDDEFGRVSFYGRDILMFTTGEPWFGRLYPPATVTLKNGMVLEQSKLLVPQ